MARKEAYWDDLRFLMKKYTEWSQEQTAKGRSPNHADYGIYVGLTCAIRRINTLPSIPDDYKAQASRAIEMLIEDYESRKAA